MEWCVVERHLRMAKIKFTESQNESGVILCDLLWPSVCRYYCFVESLVEFREVGVGAVVDSVVQLGEADGVRVNDAAATRD